MAAKNLRLLFLHILTVCLLVSAPLVTYAAEPNTTGGHHYVVKLNSARPEVLTIVGTQVNHEFTFTSNPSFAHIYSFISEDNLTQLREKLAGQYVYLELDTPFVAKAASITALPNDYWFTNNAQDIDNQWGLPKAGFVQAWSTTTGSPGVITAIIDTGIDETHEDLIGGHYTSGYDILRGVSIPAYSNSDDNGHGSLVAGVLAATTNNRRGISGTNWQTTLMPVKALDATGTGTPSDVSQAMVWAADHGAQIINMSLGGVGFEHNTTLSNAVTYAYSKNVLIVAAAGNDAAVTGGNLDRNPVFPVCDDNGNNMILGVTATDQDDIKPPFANYGNKCVDVSAPGFRIISTTDFDPRTNKYLANTYVYASGTSLAVPFVVGEAALIKAVNPNATNAQLRDHIIATADNVDNQNLSQCGGKSCRGLLGAGRINANSAVLQSILPPIKDGDLVQISVTNQIYYINGGQRRLVSPFVKSQRFANTAVRTISLSDLNKYPEAGYAEPLDGTIVRQDNDPTVYYISKGLRLPITYQIFQLRQFQFSDVVTLSYAEVTSWLMGSFLPPLEGTILRTKTNPTVYWTVGGILHPINYAFYLDRALQMFPVVYVSDNDMKSFPKGEPYIK